MQERGDHFEITIDDAILANLRATLSSTEHARIGVLSDNAHLDRDGKPQPISNAALVVVHEFGTDLIPRRSMFLRAMHEKGTDFMAFVATNRQKIMEYATGGHWTLALKKFGAQWKKYVLEGFSTRGWGEWQELSDATKARRKKGKDGVPSEEPLQDTGEMMRSITFGVFK